MKIQMISAWAFSAMALVSCVDSETGTEPTGDQGSVELKMTTSSGKDQHMCALFSGPVSTEFKQSMDTTLIVAKTFGATGTVAYGSSCPTTGALYECHNAQAKLDTGLVARKMGAYTYDSYIYSSKDSAAVSKDSLKCITLQGTFKRN